MYSLCNVTVNATFSPQYKCSEVRVLVPFLCLWGCVWELRGHAVELCWFGTGGGTASESINLLGAGATVIRKTVPPGWVQLHCTSDGWPLRSLKLGESSVQFLIVGIAFAHPSMPFANSHSHNGTLRVCGLLGSRKISSIKCNTLSEQVLYHIPQL